jgi:hypothetical protein
MKCIVYAALLEWLHFDGGSGASGRGPCTCRIGSYDVLAHLRVPSAAGLRYWLEQSLAQFAVISPRASYKYHSSALRAYRAPVGMMIPPSELLVFPALFGLVRAPFSDKGLAVCTDYVSSSRTCGVITVLPPP